MPQQNLIRISRKLIHWTKLSQLMKIGPRPEEIARARGSLAQAQGLADYAKSQLDATVKRAPVTGTILDTHTPPKRENSLRLSLPAQPLLAGHARIGGLAGLRQLERYSG